MEETRYSLTLISVYSRWQAYSTAITVLADSSMYNTSTYGETETGDCTRDTIKVTDQTEDSSRKLHYFATFRRDRTCPSETTASRGPYAGLRLSTNACALTYSTHFLQTLLLALPATTRLLFEHLQRSSATHHSSISRYSKPSQAITSHVRQVHLSRSQHPGQNETRRQ
jgi:hypothetical protein